MKYITINIFIILIIFYLINESIGKETFNKETFNNFNNEKIPKVIISTYFDKSKIPNKVNENIKKYAPNYKYIVYDDNEIALFLKRNFSHDVLNTFLTLHRGAHKADLFRYCYLYMYGGIYLDIKTKLIKNIDLIFNKKNVDFYTVLSMHKPTIYQGIIASKPKNPIFLSLIDYIVHYPKPVKKYFAFTIDFYNKLKLFYKNEIFYNGLYESQCKKFNLYLFEEKCTRNVEDCEDGLDKYKRCCYVYDNNEKIIKTRYSDYPWK